MKRFLVLFVVLFFVAPAQARNNKQKAPESTAPAVRDSVDKPFGFLPPPPPPPPLPGMSRESEQEIIDRYYRGSQPERYDDRRSQEEEHYREREHHEYRYHGDDDHHDDSLHGGKKKKHLPPGLQKKEARGKELPPGWQKKIARGEVLDRDLRDHCRELPRELRRDLPPSPKGTKLLQLEDKIIRVVEATFEIVDVFNVRR